MHIDIYDISPQKFEELAFSFLQKQSEIDCLENISKRSPDQGFDFTAKLKEEISTCKVAIEVKHRRKLSKEDLRKIALTANSIKLNFDGFILITSAKLTKDEQAFLEELIRGSGYKFIKIYQNITFESLTKTSNPEALEEIIQLNKSEKRRLTYGVASVAITLLALYLNLTPYFFSEEIILDDRIENVENALNSIKNLELYLKEIRSDMKDTQRETEAIKREYEKSLELKELTESQQNALRAAIGAASPPWWVKPLDYFFGFILGIGASVVASIIHERIKRNRILNAPA